MLAGCGGGGDSPSGASTDGFGPGNAASCPRAQLSDVWFNNRTGCLAVGQKFVNVSGSATGTKADRAFLMGQQVLDPNLNNVLGAGVLRRFKFALCVRNAPAAVAGTAMGADLATALGMGSVLRTTYYPPGVSGSTIDAASGREPAIQAMACDPAKHPVIVNFDTGLVESINVAALAGLEIYDL